jgi:Tol biopolymer transport system component
MSADGSTIVWSTPRDNDPNAWDDDADRLVYAADVATGQRRLVSADTCGHALPGRATDPDVSADGRFVAFAWDGTYLPGCVTRLDGGSQVYVKDLRTGEIDLASASTGVVPGDTYSGAPSISGDGRFVTFRSDATTVDPTNYARFTTNHYVRDRLLRTTLRVGARDGDEPASIFESVVSGDGATIGYVQYGIVDGLLNGGPYAGQVWVEPNPSIGAGVGL